MMEMAKWGHYIVRCNGTLRELTEIAVQKYRNALGREL